MYRVSPWFVAISMMYETPIRNIESKSCYHVNEKCDESAKPMSHKKQINNQLTNLH